MSLSPADHPNASAAGNAGALATLLIWAEGFWVTVPPEIAAAQATIVIAVVLGLARRLGGRSSVKPAVAADRPERRRLGRRAA